jgi:hypothetical protein
MSRPLGPHPSSSCGLRDIGSGRGCLVGPWACRGVGIYNGGGGYSGRPLGMS